MKIAIVGGGGHVGLPLGVLLSSRGHEVVAVDVSPKTVDLVSKGVPPFFEEGLEQLLTEVINQGSFTITTEKEAVCDSDCVVFVVGTPVDEFLMPNPNEVVDSVLEFLEFIPPNALVILRSTVFPGVSQKLLRAIEQRNRSNYVVYAPERIAEGKAMSELLVLPQIIGGNNETASDLAAEIFGCLTSKVLFATFEEAELAKLFTNVWRYIKFSASNQFFMMANEMGVDYARLRNLVTDEYPRAHDLPSAGFTAGPCLFKDTMQLAALVQQNFPLGIAAMSINEGIPGYIVKRLSESLELHETKVGILGMSFKADNDDIRGSLAFKLRKLLQFHCKEVYMTDPFVDSPLNRELGFVVNESDVLVIATPHSIYSNLKVENKKIVDIWNFLQNGTLF